MRATGIYAAALIGRLGANWERERRDTLFLMLPALLAAILHVAWLPAWVGAAFLGLFAWRLGLLARGSPLPGTALRWAGVLSAVAAVWAEYGTLIGSNPGVSLLLLFLGLKFLEIRARRDLLVLVFLILFLLLAAFLHSQSMLTAVVVFIAFVGLLTAMVTLQYRRNEASIARRFQTSGTLILHAMPVAAVLFLLFPRPESALWTLPGHDTQATTGLSEKMSPGTIASLGESRAIAFRVRFDTAMPARAALYWRGPAFGDFDGRSWIPLTKPVTPPPAAWIRPGHGESVSYTVIQEPSERPWLFTLEMPTAIEMPPGMGASVLPDLQVIASGRQGERLRFRVQSSLDSQTGLNESRLSLQNWLELPAGFNPRTLQMAADWRAAQPGTLDGNPVRRGDGDRALVERALAMFREQPFRYTLSPPRLGQHTVDDFLFRTRAGFCEHYAASFVVLMRALDVPARVVTGYQGGELNPVDGWWLVRQADAHAWAEVWLAGEGWVRVDPTAAVAPERIEQGVRQQFRMSGSALFDQTASIVERLRHGVDSISNAWNRWVISYDQGGQQKLLERLGIGTRDWRALAGFLAIGLLAAVSIVALVALGLAPRRDPVLGAWDEFCARLAQGGLPRQAHETPNAFMHRIERSLEPSQTTAARRIVSLYGNLRYEAGLKGAAGDDERRRHMREFTRCVRQFKL